MERGKRTAREEIRWKKRRHATHTTTPSRCYTCCPHFGSSPNKPERQEEERNSQSRTHCTALHCTDDFWNLWSPRNQETQLLDESEHWVQKTILRLTNGVQIGAQIGANLGIFAATVGSPWQTETRLFFSKGTG